MFNLLAQSVLDEASEGQDSSRGMKAVKYLMSYTYELLGVLHMLKYLKSKRRSLTIKVKNAFSSHIERSRRYTSSIMH